MTRRLRIYRGIAVLASLAAMGPQMAACSEEGPSSSKISSRFSTSLEQAAPTSSVMEEERNELIVNDNDNNNSQRRELLSWWSLAVQVGEY